MLFIGWLDHSRDLIGVHVKEIKRCCCLAVWGYISECPWGHSKEKWNDYPVLLYILCSNIFLAIIYILQNMHNKMNRTSILRFQSSPLRYQCWKCGGKDIYILNSLIKNTQIAPAKSMMLSFLILGNWVLFSLWEIFGDTLVYLPLTLDGVTRTPTKRGKSS